MKQPCPKCKGGKTFWIYDRLSGFRSATPCPKCAGKGWIIQRWSDDSLHGGPCPDCKATGKQHFREIPLWLWWLLAVLILGLLLFQAGRPRTPGPVKRVAWTVPVGGALWDRAELAGARDWRIWAHEVGALNGWGNRVPMLHAGEEIVLLDWREGK